MNEATEALIKFINTNSYSEGGERKGWEGWSSWSSCSTSCGQGVETRYRFCGDSYPGTELCKVRHQYSDGCHTCLITRGHGLLLASACLLSVLALQVYSQVPYFIHPPLHAQHQSMEPHPVHVDVPTSSTPVGKMTRTSPAETST